MPLLLQGPFIYDCYECQPKKVPVLWPFYSAASGLVPPPPQLPHPPVLAASTVSDEWLGEDGHFLLSGKAGTLVSWEFQLHSRVQQGEVAPHNQGMRGAYRQGD